MIKALEKCYLMLLLPVTCGCDVSFGDESKNQRNGEEIFMGVLNKKVEPQK